MIPKWERAASAELARAAARTLVITSATPDNLIAELASLRAAFASGAPRAPRFRYRRRRAADPRALEELAERLERAEDALALLYAGRARELALEARMCLAVGTAAFFALARTRYARRDEHDARADELASEWLGAGETAPEASVLSDDEADPQSLVRRMRAEIGRRRLPFRVVVSERLSALAATGAGVVYVAANKRLSLRAVERTVLHEIEGHAMPRARATSQPLGLFRVGSARGSDEQEGRAIAIEERAGMLAAGRRVELARRHVACRLLERGADFVETVRGLRDAGAPLEDALRIAARAHRGGGLGREAVYLAAFSRVRAATRTPKIEELLSRGQLSVEAALALAQGESLARVSARA